MALSQHQLGGMRITTDVDQVSGAVVCFTERAGGVSAGPYESLNLSSAVGDDPAAVERNRGLIAAALGRRAEELTFVRQVHGTHVLEIDGPGASGEGDGLVTSSRDVVLGILTADCAPVVIAGRGAVGIAHAGWRGLASGVIEAVVDAVGGPQRAWVGPCIHACCYHVGPDVTEAFAAAGLPLAAPDRVDIADAARAALERAGVTWIDVDGSCTAHDARYFSYRRDGTTGRQAGFVMLGQ
ncbi:MAG: polyphenol oxidase family protein [Actinomycetota bacterium]|nr:polyphenol oxidase family protein [Actinomycetota bacterium]